MPFDSSTLPPSPHPVAGSSAAPLGRARHASLLGAMVIWIAALALLAGPPAAHAQMLTYTRALMTTPSFNESSQAYQLEYRQGLFDGFSASIDYLNEGHIAEHHRDGYAFEFSYRLPILPHQRLYLAASAGPYYFFDTYRGSTDVHEVAPLVALTAYGALKGKWFWSATATRINPKSDFRANMFGIGLGYWLGKDAYSPTEELPGLFGSTKPGKTSDEITVFGVFSVINVAKSPHSLGSSVEYRHRFARHVEGTVTYIYEGDPRVARRSGLAVQAWPVRSAICPQLEIGIGLGTYWFIDRRHVRTPGQNANAALGGLVSTMISYHFTPTWFGALIWDRVITDYNRDADIWRFGIGRKL
ncbi:MAG TPA: hypothetical protein VHE61_16520 [Opitutaceae bacterium]|nr:hypothetical protein [Opitutaceae bacterium]